ncbi:MAG: inositol monophosphatase [Bacteroidaceae bacterium]|nr:inositol monophosphatase [Bacteroidaceae bacterium]
MSININKFSHHSKFRKTLFLVEERKKFDVSRVEQKRSHDYVSYVDKQSERLIVSRLKELLPEAGFIAEEGSGSMTDEPYCWVVDPLDGTTNFIHNNAPYCVSIGLRDREGMLLGVVYECCRGELFWANRYSRAYLGDQPICVSRVGEMDSAAVLLGFTYDAERYHGFIVPLIHRLYGRVAALRLQGSAAAEICYVAAGRFETRVEALIGPWDVAAASIILKQAGGRMSDFSGEESEQFYSGREVLVSNGWVHEAMLAAIADMPPVQ